jgi:hypothetical protein
MAANPDAEPAHVLEMFELTMAKAEVEAQWCERVARRIEAGELAG